MTAPVVTGETTLAELEALLRAEDVALSLHFTGRDRPNSGACALLPSLGLPWMDRPTMVEAIAEMFVAVRKHRAVCFGRGGDRG